MHTDYASPGAIFKIAITINLLSVIWNIISDCDETYNYWEPLHFVIYGKGFQTWEYSPTYSLRSYLYLILYGWPAILLNLFFKSLSSRFLFYLIRIYMACITSWLEMDLYKSFRLYLKNPDEFMVPVYCLLILMLSAGSFIASTAFLPSSFAFYCSILTLSSWLKSDNNVLIASVAFSAILGWPFSAAIGIPFAIDLLFFQRKLRLFIKYSLFWGFVFTTASVVVDSWFYGRITFPSLNIILYNVFTSHGGPELYGVEPAMFYVKNYILNFNIATIFVLISFFIPAAQFSFYRKVKITNLNRLSIMSVGVIFVWNSIFFLQAHKEERFLFPCYPFVAVAAGICLFHCQTIFNYRFSCRKFIPKQTISTVFLVIFSCISASRILAIILSYHAPISLYSHLNDVLLPNTTTDKLLCLGREWHRFPSSFLVTGSRSINISFIRSDFKGQLPGKYRFSNDGNLFDASRDVNQHFNDRNKEEESRYVGDVLQCDFIVDRIDNQTGSANEPNWELLTTGRWRSILKYRLLNPSSSVGSRNSLFRSFYLPFVFEKYNQFVDYAVLEKSIK